MKLNDWISKYNYKVDFETDGNTIYYCQYNGNVSIPNIDGFKCIPVPYLMYDVDGNPDFANMDSYAKVDSVTTRELSKACKSLNLDVNFNVRFNNLSKGIPSRFSSESQIQPTSEDISNRLAYVNGGTLDTSICKYSQLTDMLSDRAKGLQKIVYYHKDSIEEQTYTELYQEAQVYARGLLDKGLSAKDRLIFQVEDNRQFLVSFWACMMVGIVPAPTSTPSQYVANSSETNKLSNIKKLLETDYVLTTRSQANTFAHIDEIESLKGLKVIYTEDLNTTSKPVNLYQWQPDETCLILFTSGSTGLPKGVQLSTSNVFARNLGEIQRYNLGSDNVDLNWMTFTHAAGLIWSHLRDVYLNILQVQVDSAVILTNPLKWLDIISEYNVSITWSPNFAFALVNNTLKENPDKKHSWNLERLKYIYSGGEANISRVLREFLKLLEPYGLPSYSIRPAFGMTETSSCITYYDGFSYQTTKDTDNFVPIGTPMSGCEARIVDDDGNIVNERVLGHLECKGKSFTCGYYRNPIANESSFTKDGFLITGDLGYIEDGKLVLTGREKDIIIINGQNYYIQDIEASTDDVDGVAPSFSVATSISNQDGTEEVLVLFVPQDETLLENQSFDELRTIVDSIRNNVRERCHLNPKHIVPITTAESVRTEIGKKQRNYYRDMYIKGAYDEIINLIEKRVSNGIITKHWIKAKNSKRIDDIKSYSVMFLDKEQQSLLTPTLDSLGIEYNVVSSVEGVSEHLIDFTFYSENILPLDETNLNSVLTKASQHINMIAKLDIKCNVIFPTKNAIVGNGDTIFNLEGSFLRGVLSTLMLENPNVHCVQVDFDKLSMKNLLLELNTVTSTVMFRNDERYIPVFTSEQAFNDNTFKVKDGELILAVGGLGGIGYNVCKSLLHERNAHILIIGTSPIDNYTNHYNNLLEISKNVMYVQADVLNIEEVSQAIANAENIWNMKLTSILNFAGKFSSYATSQEYFADINSHVLANEVANNYVSASKVRVLGTKTLVDYCLKRGDHVKITVFSSVTSQFGSVAIGAYSGANTIQEQYCESIQKMGYPIRCLQWSYWKGVGMNSGITTNSNTGFMLLESFDGVSAYKAFECVPSGSSCVGINRNESLYIPMLHDSYNQTLVTTVHTSEDRNTIANLILNEFKTLQGSIEYNVKRVSEEYSFEDSNELELIDRLKSIWQTELNLEDFNLIDNFFDLGGNSVTVYRITTKLTDIGLKVSPADLMTYPSIYQLTKYLLSSTPKQSTTTHRKRGTMRRRNVKL